MGAQPAVLLLLLLAVAVSAAPRNPKMDMFPQRFSVHTGTTIPLNYGLDSITQAGMVHYDGVSQWLRMDHKYLGKDVSFIARFGEGRLYLLNDGACVNVSVNGTLMPFATPKGSVLSSELTMIRDTVVVTYNGVMRAMDGKLHTLDFYVKQANRTLGDAPGNWIPWRTTYGRLLRREIGPSAKQAREAPNEDDVEQDGDAESDNRDWRFYKGVDEEDREKNSRVGTYMKPAGALSVFEPGQKVTTDYFNFQATAPAPELFEPPESCKGSTQSSDVKFSFADHGRGYGHQIFEFQKTLSDLSADFPHITHNLLEDACLRYFCDVSEKANSRDARPMSTEP